MLKQCWSGFIFSSCKGLPWVCKRLLKPLSGCLAAGSRSDMQSKALVAPQTLCFSFRLCSGIFIGTEVTTGANQYKEAYGKFLVQWKVFLQKMCQ